MTPTRRNKKRALSEANKLRIALRNASTVEADCLLSQLRTIANDFDEPTLREALGKALVNATSSFGAADDMAKVSEFLEELRGLSGSHDEPALREQLGKALVNACSR